MYHSLGRVLWSRVDVVILVDGCVGSSRLQVCCTGCLSKHVLSISYQLSVSPFFSDTAPVYLSDLLHVYSPSRHLRSSSDSRTVYSVSSFFSDAAPVYLSDLLRVYSPSRHLRSSTDSRTLCILSLPSSLMQPLCICLTFCVCTLHQDSSAHPLTQEVCVVHTFGHCSFSSSAS